MQTYTIAEPKGSFYEWLIKQGHRNEPVGDLAKDSIADANFPKEVKSHRTARQYLKEHGACSGAIEAMRQAWAEYSDRVASKIEFRQAKARRIKNKQ